MQKKLLALLLSFSLLASLFAIVPVSVSAEETESPEPYTLISDDDESATPYGDISSISPDRALLNASTKATLYGYNSTGRLGSATGTRAIKSMEELTNADYAHTDTYPKNSGIGDTKEDGEYFIFVADIGYFAYIDTIALYNRIASNTNTNAAYRLRDFDFLAVGSLDDIATAEALATYKVANVTDTARMRHILTLQTPVRARYIALRVRDWGTNMGSRFEINAYGELDPTPVLTSETFTPYSNTKYYDGVNVANSIITGQNSTLYHRAYQMSAETSTPEKVVDTVIPFHYNAGNDRGDAFDNDYHSNGGHGTFSEIKDSNGYLYNDLIVELDGEATINQFALINGTSDQTGKYWLRHFDLYVVDSIDAIDTATPVATYEAGENTVAKRHIVAFPVAKVGKVIALRIYDVNADDSYPRIEFNVYGEYNTEHVHKYTEKLQNHLRGEANCQGGKTYWKYCNCGESVSTEDYFTVGEADANVHFGGTATCKALAQCEGCGVSYGTINPNNHEGTLNTIPAKAATCTATGLTAGKKYSCCGLVTVKQTATKALGHSYGAYSVTKKATTSANGTLTKKCTRSGCTATSSTTIYKIKTIKLSTTEYTYSGKAKKPSVTVKDSKGNKISSKYYTVSYAKGRKNVGKYKVTVKFKGNYSGTKNLYFTINPKKTSVKSISAGSKKLTVKWSKQKSQVTGYEIQYSTSSKFTSKTTKKTTVKSYKTTSKTIKKLKAKKKYYVRIRTYKTVSGKKYYSDWSSKKSKTTKK